MLREFDVVVLGGGPAGYVSAIRAAQLGASVAIIEKDKIGGTCLNRGCIPTKSYLSVTETINHYKKLLSSGIVKNKEEIFLDMKNIYLNKNKVVESLTSGVKSLLLSNKVEIYQGIGIIKDKNTVSIDDKLEICSKSIIAAGGSVSSVLPIKGFESKKILFSETLLDLDYVPKSLTIIGGGVIGVEFADIFNTLGSDITIVEIVDRILPLMDKDLSTVKSKHLSNRGIKIKTNVKIDRFEDDSNFISTILSNGDVIKSEYVLFSVGRKPDLSCLGSNLKFDIDSKNYVVVSDDMRTSIDNIYAPGDINGRKTLAHAAFMMGEVAAENAVGHKRNINLKYIPNVVYGDLEIASIGMNEEEARAIYPDAIISIFPMSANGRALSNRSKDGFVKVIIDKKYKEILGVHMAGMNVSEIINEVSALMSLEITATEIIEISHAHPTVSEAFYEAIAMGLNRAIHYPKKL